MEMALSIVVLPEPVPPEMTMLKRLAPAIFSAVAMAFDIDPPAGVTGTAVLGEIEIEYVIDRGPKTGTVTGTAAATETEIMTIIALGAVGPLAHPYADVLAAALVHPYVDVLAAAHARALAPVTVLGHVLDLIDGDLGLGVARLLLL